MGNLSGKTALVTGAASGIGEAIARRFAGDGARVWAVDVDEAGLRTLAAAAAVSPVALDLADAAAIARLPGTTGHVDVLVNCAAVFARGSVLDCSEEDWRRTFAINVDAVFRLVAAFLPGMVERTEGSIVNIASVASSIMALPNRFAYGASKAAVIGLTKSVALDAVPSGVRCNAICPGTVATSALVRAIDGAPDPDAVRRRYLAQQPGGRLGRPEEIAALAAFLASDEARFITGAEYVIDGGMSL